MTEPVALKVIAFPGAPNLPIFAAQELGHFAEAGCAVELTTTPSSAFQAEKLHAGDFHIACTAFDNVVAYREGQGAVDLTPPPDFCVIMGATEIELALVAAPDMGSVANLKGRSIALDALATGFAFVAYHMLAEGGIDPADCPMAPVGATPQRWESVKSGEHAATITIEPFTSIALANGFRVLDRSTRTLSPYQGGIVAASRAWADAHPAAVRAFIRGYRAGLDWTLDAANRQAAADLLMRHMPAIKPGVVDAVMDGLLDSRSGLTPGGAVTMAGMRTVLDLRARYAGTVPLGPPEKYLDLSHYRSVTASR